MKTTTASKVMTAAWVIRKATACTMSVALTQAWAAAKAPKPAATADQLVRAEMQMRKMKPRMFGPAMREMNVIKNSTCSVKIEQAIQNLREYNM